MDDLNKLRDKAYKVARLKGFYTEDWEREFDKLHSDLLSELVELRNAKKFHKFAQRSVTQNKVSFEFSETVKDTVQDELADIIIRILSFCGYWTNINIQWHVEQKIKFNLTRPYLHKETGIRELNSCSNCGHLENMVLCLKHRKKVLLNNVCV